MRCRARRTDGSSSITATRIRRSLIGSSLRATPGPRKSDQGPSAGTFGRGSVGMIIRAAQLESCGRRGHIQTIGDAREVDDGTGTELVTHSGPEHLDRKSVEKGQSVSVRVDPGGCRIIKKKTKT